MIYQAGQLRFLFCHVLMCVVVFDTVSLDSVVLVSCVQNALPRCFHCDSTAKLLQSLGLAYAAAPEGMLACMLGILQGTQQRSTTAKLSFELNWSPVFCLRPCFA